MNVGVAKEIKQDEYRVALTPAGALELTRHGHNVVVEQGAGEGSAFPDSAYMAVGARIGSVEEVWADSELVLKVKEPIPEEFGRLREGQVLFTYLHLAASEELTTALMESGSACVAYETVETDDRALPLLAPMSEIAGRLASQAGATFLETPRGGRGLLLRGDGEEALALVDVVFGDRGVVDENLDRRLLRQRPIALGLFQILHRGLAQHRFDGGLLDIHVALLRR